MEIPDLSDDSMDDPLYNPDEDVSEDEDIEAATEAALNAEAGELKEDEPKDPLKDDNRIDFANVGLSPEDYIKSRIPQETKKSTKQAVKLYDTVMGKKATMDGTIFKPILETPVDELPNMLSSYVPPSSFKQVTQIQSQTSRSNDGGQAYKKMRVETEENTRQDI